jgi:hypothetical protein
MPSDLRTLPLPPGFQTVYLYCKNNIKSLSFKTGGLVPKTIGKKQKSIIIFK